LKGKRLGVQSIGGGVWSMAMLALEHLGLESTRDKLTVMIIGDSPILAQSLESGGIQNMARLLAVTNPKVKTVRMEDVVDEAPFQRLEKTSFYRELVAQTKK
jgi:hypothetical protein